VENVDKRNALRAGAVSAAATLMMLITSPVFANARDDGDDPGSGLTVAQTLGLFVGIPVLSFLLIAGLVMLPSMGKDKKK
jgi:hypothetical protein